MGIFDINLHSKKTEYHSYGTDDVALQAIGMSSYTKSSLEKYLSLDEYSLAAKANGTLAENPDVLEFFTNDLTGTRDALLGVGNNEEEPSILYAQDKNKYVLKTGDEILQTSTGTQVFADIKELLKKHNDIELGITPATSDEKEVINNIQVSYSGCITFRPTFKVLTCERKPLVRLYIKPRKNNDTSRTVGFNGPPLIAAIPNTAVGMAHSLQDSNNLPAGQYSPPQEGGTNNPANVVAANLKMTYNSSLGMFESGTQQVLARLLTDVDAAPITSLQDIDSIDSIPMADLYDPDSPHYLGQFSTGLAIPLSVENGNPHQFGPDSIGGCDTNAKKVKIEVVNRSPRSFKKGDVVICSHIGKEWIIQGFDNAEIKTQSNVKITKWAFQKYIVTSDYFFRSFTDGGSVKSKMEYLTPSEYESKSRMKYYNGYFTTNRPISLLNMYIAEKADDAVTKRPPAEEFYNIYLNKSYYKSTIFDQLDDSMGGLAERNLIGRTNIVYSPDGIPGDPTTGRVYGQQIPTFWGPVFTEGYNAQQVANLKNNPRALTVRYNKNYTVSYNDILKGGADGTKIFSKETNENALLDKANFMFSDILDGNVKQLPAEAALLGNMDNSNNFSYSIENYFEDIPERPKDYEIYMRDTKRYCYLADTGNIDIYGLSPVQPAKIQFSPLSLEFALSHVDVLNRQDIYLQQLKNNLTELVDLYEYGAISSKKTLLGQQFFTRNVVNDNTPINNSDVNALIPFGPYGITNDGAAPVGGPFLIPNSSSSRERSNVIGIIASKMKFTAPSNGSLNFTTNQYFGLTPKVTIAGGQTTPVTVLGAFLSWGGGTNPLQQNSIPQWGDSSRTDNYNSWGTTALHVRIFDQWPERDTIYDGRYFAVLHFNPDVLPDNYMRFDKLGADFKDYTKGDDNDDRGIYTDDNTAYIVKNKDVDNDKLTWDEDKPLPSNYKVQINVAETSVDFKVPSTKLVSPEIYVYDAIVGNVISPSGFINDDHGNRLAPVSQWNVDPIRRGKLLTGGGFRYYQRVIGANELEVNHYKVTENGEEVTKYDRGKDYKRDDIIRIGSGGATAKVLSVDGDGGIVDITTEFKGENYLPSDFDIPLSVSNVSGSMKGSGAKIKIKNGIVYNMVKQDLGPQERCPITKLTLPSNNEGNKPADGSLSTNVQLNGGNGKYDAFFFFHNDILHTTTFSTTYTPGFAQYVNLEINAG
jgi:hypothetical protein